MSYAANPMESVTISSDPTEKKRFLAAILIEMFGSHLAGCSQGS